MIVPANETIVPGLHYRLSADRYHALPYLSASGMRRIIEDCPAVYRWLADHPEANEPSRDAEIGSAAHLLFLEPGLADSGLVVVDAEDYRSGMAREKRAEARSRGLLPVLAPDLAIARSMVDALQTQVPPLPAGMAMEVTYVWSDRDTGVWLKARPDGASPGLIIDYKTTANAHPEAWPRRVADNAHHIQAAHYLNGHERLTGRRADFLWIVQSSKPPHLAAVHRPTESTLSAGREKVRAAIDIYNLCTQTGLWPGYEAPTPDGIWPLTLPGWAQLQHEERRMQGQFERRPAASAAARAFAITMQSPEGTK